MSIEAETITAAVPRNKALWRMRMRQFKAVARLEIRKNFVGWRAVLLYLIAAGPVFLLGAFSIVFQIRSTPSNNMGQLTIIFANVFEGLILRNVVFFGSAWMFMNLFRGEVVDRSLHYYLMTPMRREVLVASKYTSGLAAAAVMFGVSTVTSFVFALSGLGYQAGFRFIFDRQGLSMGGAYLGITLLAVAGYGALFMLLGLFFRNPVIPGVVIYGWEWLNFLLPPGLKKISIIHYLHSLSPVPIPEGPFALVGDVTPAWLSIFWLLVLIAGCLFISGLRIRRVEIKYGTD